MHIPVLDMFLFLWQSCYFAKGDIHWNAQRFPHFLLVDIILDLQWTHGWDSRFEGVFELCDSYSRLVHSFLSSELMFCFTYYWVVVDEISFQGYKLFCYLHQNLHEGTLSNLWEERLWVVCLQRSLHYHRNNHTKNNYIIVVLEKF